MRRLIVALTLALGLAVVGAHAQEYYRGSAVSGSGVVSSALIIPDGTAPAPAIAFASQPGLGFYRSSAGVISFTGGLTSTGSVTAATFFRSNTTGATMNLSINDGWASLLTFAGTIGSTLKFDALPTVGSGFGTTPSITAGSTPLAGSVNVGTGGAATSGVVTFNGTAFPSAPFCTYSTTTTNAVTRGTPTTTQLTLASTTAWTASDVVTWHCISSK